jgi:hypothetical protein
MRNLLFSTVIASGAKISSAFANEADFNVHVSFAEAGTDEAGVEGTYFAKDWEFEFRGSQDLDNGMRVFVDLEIDAAGNGVDGEDERLATDDITAGVSGSFGTITVGKFNDGKVAAGLGMVQPAAGSVHFFGGLEAGHYSQDGANQRIHNYNDEGTIAYTTPSIGGFTVGALYQIDGTTRSVNGGSDAANTRTEVTSVGARYDMNVNDVSVRVGGAYRMASAPAAANDDNSFAMSVRGTVGGVTAGIAYRNGDDGDGYNITQVGARYGSGPWSVSAAFATGSDGAVDYHGYDLGARYNLGAGTFVSGGYTSDENNGNQEAKYSVGINVGF